MRMQLHDIQSKEVVALKEGRNMGAVDQVFIQPNQRKLAGLTVRESRLSGNLRWVDAKQVTGVGEDYLFVPKAAALRNKKPTGRSLKDLTGVPVISRDGDNLGSLVDVEVDDSWRVVEISLSGKRVVAIQPDKLVIGPDTILLRQDVSGKVRTTREQKPGVMARLFGEDAVREAGDLLSRAEKATGKAADKAAEQKKAAEKTARKASEKAKRAGGKATGKKTGKKKPGKKTSKKKSSKKQSGQSGKKSSS